MLYAAVAELCYLAVSKEMLKHRETLMLREEKGKDRNDLRIHLGWNHPPVSALIKEPPGQTGIQITSSTVDKFCNKVIPLYFMKIHI